MPGLEEMLRAYNEVAKHTPLPWAVYFDGCWWDLEGEEYVRREEPVCLG